MNQSSLALVLASSAAFLVATPAAAQGLFKRLTDRVQQAVERKAEQTLSGVVAGHGSAPASTQSPSASAQSPSASPQSAASRPKPARPAESGSYTSQIAPPAGFATTYAAYVKFAEVPCDDCEGGIEPAGWPRFPSDHLSGRANDRAMRIGAFSIGHVHRWQVRGAAGSLTVLGEAPVNGLRCRQLNYRVTRGKHSAERPGLVCFGRQYASSSLETWHEIY